MASINIEPDEHVTCTFTNVKRGIIVVQKTTAPAGDPEVFPITLIGPTSGSSSVTDGGDHTFIDRRPGLYTLSETLTADWRFDSVSCDGGQPIPSSASVTFTLGPGETITCGFMNTKLGNLTIVKDAVPDAAQDFDFACSYLGHATLDDDGDPTLSNTHTFARIDPRDYTCTESIVEGWRIESDCDGGSPTQAGNSLNFTVDPGETVVCTFTNTFSPNPNPVGGVAGLLRNAEFDIEPVEQIDSSATRTPWFALYLTLPAFIFAAVMWRHWHRRCRRE